MEMKSLTMVKEVHILNGRLAVLNRFLSKSTESASLFPHHQEEWKVESLHRLHRFKQGLPKVSFLLPNIDQMINVTAGHKLLSFMNAYSVQPDQDATNR